MAWRLLFLLLILALAMVGAAWLADRPGAVAVEWQGYKLETSVGVLMAAVVLAGMAVAFGYLIWRGLIGAPGAWFGRRSERRRQRGLRSLGLGMVAVAAGDPDEAQRQARAAAYLLEDSPLTRLLAAQAAQLNGDNDAARKYFTAMLANPETAFLGLRGLLMQAMRDGDQAKALRLAEQAYGLKPNTPWVVHALFDMQARAGQWGKAQETLAGGLRHRTVTQERGRSLRAMLLVERSRQAERAGNRFEALKYAKDAHGAEPDRIVVAARYADRLLNESNPRKAKKIVKRAWALQPHPDLAKLYLAAVNDADPARRLRALEEMSIANRDHIETHLVLAQEALEARLWGEARRHLAAAAGADPPARVCRLMADLEEQEHGNGDAVRMWLTRATVAPIDKHWRCQPCGMVVERWQSVCPNCGAFGTIDWRSPPRYQASDEPSTPPPQIAAPRAPDKAIASPADIATPPAEIVVEAAAPVAPVIIPTPAPGPGRTDTVPRPQPVQMPPRIDPLA